MSNYNIFMKNHTVTVNYFELHQVPIGFRRMTTPLVSSLGFRGWTGAGRPTWKDGGRAGRYSLLHRLWN
jgi:hypothetical protein